MALKVKKNKTPKSSKQKKSKPTMLQKQSVSQNVKVNIYKPERVPKEYKIKQLGRDGAGGRMPNVRELPSSSFQIVNNQPRPLLYNELFGNARPVSTSPFERLLATQAVEDNRQAQVGQLKNSLESSRLKTIQREPILAPSFRGESEQELFTARATASMEDNRRPFSVTSVDEQGTLGASFKARIPQSEYLQERTFGEYQVLPPEPRGAYTRSSSSTIESVLQDAQSQPELPRGESDTFRTFPDAEQATVESTYEEAPDRKKDAMILGVPDIPDRLISYAKEQGTSGDLLEAQRGEIVPVSQGAVEAYEIDEETNIVSKPRGRGAPKTQSRTPEEEARKEAQREATARTRMKQGVAEAKQSRLQGAFDIMRGTPQALKQAQPVKTLIQHFGGSSRK